MARFWEEDSVHFFSPQPHAKKNTKARPSRILFCFYSTPKKETTTKELRLVWTTSDHPKTCFFLFLFAEGFFNCSPFSDFFWFYFFGDEQRQQFLCGVLFFYHNNSCEAFLLQRKKLGCERTNSFPDLTFLHPRTLEKENRFWFCLWRPISTVTVTVPFSHPSTLRDRNTSFGQLSTTRSRNARKRKATNNLYEMWFKFLFLWRATNSG